MEKQKQKNEGRDSPTTVVGDSLSWGNGMGTYLPAYLKTQNRTRVMDLFLEHKEMTRPDISKLTGISMPTVIKIVDFLISKNILIENPEDMIASDSGFGRRSQVLRLNSGACSTIGVYFEGNALRIGLVNMAFEIVEEKEFPLKPIQVQSDKRDWFSHMIVDELRRLIDCHPETNILGVGFALPGIVDCTNKRIRRSKNYPVSEDFYESFPVFKNFQEIPLYLENDMNAASLGEMIQRKLFQNANLLYLSLGTGFGSGVIIDGQIWHGTSYFAGNVARILIPETSEEGLRYGQKKYVEDYICQRELQNKFHFDFRSPESCSLEKRREVMRYISQFLAFVIHNLSHLFDIHDFVMAGLTVEYFGDLFFEILEEEIHKTDDPDRAKPEIHIMPSVSGKEGIVGAAYVAFSNGLPQLLAESR